jgi:hypothetical protein
VILQKQVSFSEAYPMLDSFHTPLLSVNLDVIGDFITDGILLDGLRHSSYRCLSHDLLLAGLFGARCAFEPSFCRA